ncbi:putative thiol-disulfide oxidoreductase [Gordonia hirsuta DSM 44140 = NBRC 16056]|uniref:Putative thiol-disulfide oxidoreductase n=1 Tax=Gordonia hirsuta DSM 44140 = NBRC 16056 TaxID=1121927 RepID=L7LB80_9ACTN|nr:TlpA disulfide reductase family protein [Gordonia hirsuta]GAC58179.1 putative thiol-disulfide oxidoreductase [Gordonia hirsuta DSM 44140 = NBRC 16056]
MKHLKTPAAKAMIAFVVVTLGLIVALWPRGGDTVPAGGLETAGGGITDEAISPEMLAQARAEAALPPCPQSSAPVPAGAALNGVSAYCLTDGKPIDLGQATAGQPVVINMWAVWCLPCRKELPVFAELYRRAGDRLDVLAVHARDGANKPYALLQFLDEVDVRIPTVADVDGTVAKALRAPRVFPSTILVRADGTVASISPRVFDSYDELAELITEELGIDLTGGGS